LRRGLFAARPVRGAACSRRGLFAARSVRGAVCSLRSVYAAQPVLLSPVLLSFVLFGWNGDTGSGLS
jgi:hypothetical protein